MVLPANFSSSIFITILLLTITIKNAKSQWLIYGNQVLLIDELNLLEPENIFENHKILHGVLESNETTYNDTCTRDIAAVNGALITENIWALQMLDASSKIPTGILKGNIIDLGVYDECIAIEGQYLGIEVKGQHCMYSLGVKRDNVSLPIDPTLSICVPRSCTAEDIKDVINSTFDLISKFKKIDVRLDSVTCAIVDREIWDTEFIIWSLILGIFIGFLLVCSVSEAYVRQKPAGTCRSSLLDVLSQFSLQRSAAAILSTEKREGSLPSLDGLRVLSMAWVVLGHEYVNESSNVPINGVDLLPWVQSWHALFILNGLYAVDTFFTLSGFLMTYMFMKHMAKNKSFNVFSYYIHRFIRLTPAVFGLLVICIIFVPKIGSGARWDFYMDQYLTTCRDKIWPTLFYVQNSVNIDNFCLGHLWYLSVDMQLFWISPLILYPLYKKPKIGLALLTILLVMSIAIPAFIIGTNHYQMFSSYVNLNETQAKIIFQEVYEKTYNRAAPWLIGIIFGFEVASNNRTLSKKIICYGWLTTFISFAFCLLGTKIFTDPNYTYNPVWETFFYVAGKPIWAFGICWICYASIYNCAGPISKVLSLEWLAPFSRLSYSIYLVHFVIQIMRVGATRTPTYFCDFNIIHVFFGDILISVIVAFIFCLTFESPFVVFEKILFKRQATEMANKKQFNHLEDRSDEEEIISRED